MGLFDKFKSNVEINDEKEAFFATVFACMAVDGEISQEEQVELMGILSKKQIFRNTNIRSMVEKTVKLFQQVGGSMPLIEIAAPKISDNLKLTLFATCADLVLADGVVNQAEKNLMESLQKLLSVDAANAEKVIEVIIIKNKG